MTASAIRPAALAGVAFCVLMMAVALSLEHIAGLEPCPLCIFSTRCRNCRRVSAGHRRYS